MEMFLIDQEVEQGLTFSNSLLLVMNLSAVAL
jgi:hypothetical protein